MRENLYAASPAVILAHAMRLASLVEGTPAYAQCIELIKKDIEDFATTTPEDAARIATNYTAAERIAVMHVCGACGVRDRVRPIAAEWPPQPHSAAGPRRQAAIRSAQSQIKAIGRCPRPLPGRWPSALT
jgi:hypothetical protein